MNKEIILPSLGEGIEEVVVSELLVSKGDIVTKDDTLLLLESEKATMEIPSEYSGTITSLYISENDTISPGTKILDMVVTDDIKDNSNKDGEKDSEPVIDNSNAKQASSNIIPLEEKFSATDNIEISASPGVRKLSRDLDIDLKLISGSGSKGRITRDDLHSYIKDRLHGASGRPEIDFSAWGDVNIISLTKINQITGNRLQSSWQEIPHVTQFDNADITKLNEIKNINKGTFKKKGLSLTILPYIIKFVTESLQELKRFNSSLSIDGNSIITKEYINVGIAIDTKKGLVVPNIKNIEQKNIEDIATDLDTLVKKAHSNKLSPSDFEGGTFTISSLGGLGGTYFTPIINPPEVAILGISKARFQSVDTSGNGKKFESRLIMPYSLSYDHRVIDGVQAVKFTKNLAERIESFREQQ